MKVVINRCYGGFGLSKEAVKRMAELQGRPCYLFTQEFSDRSAELGRYVPTSHSKKELLWHAFDVPNPNDVLAQSKPWHEMNLDERHAHNELYVQRSVDSKPGNRSDPLLIRVVEELGKKANGHCAALAIIEIPDGIEYDVEEYDGLEWVAEKHRTWR